jgi:hypothetical protein
VGSLRVRSSDEDDDREDGGDSDPYAASDSSENLITFRLDSFADDDSTWHLYSIMIRPCFLPVGMSTTNRIIKPGYKSYQPVVAA